MNKKSLAVLIPVFNNQEGLLSSLDSLRGQIDFEHVFNVDDGWRVECRFVCYSS